MAQERNVSSEKKSLFNSRLFKFGLLFVAAGILLDSVPAIAVGFAAMGGAWAAAK